MLSTTVMGSVFGVAASTFQEKITLNFIFTKLLVSNQIIENLFDRVLEHLFTVSFAFENSLSNYSGLN